MTVEIKTQEQLEQEQAKSTLGEIDDMLASVGQEESSTETDKEPEEVKEEEVKEEESKEEKEVSEEEKDKDDKGEEEKEEVEEKDEEKEVKEEEEDKEVVEEGEPSIDKVREEYEEKMSKLRKAVEDTATESVARKPVEETTEEDTKPKGRPTGEYIVEETEFDEAIKSKEAMNALLTKVRDDAIETVYREITPMVNRTVSHQMGLSNLVRTFYSENPDLEPYKKFVGKVTLRIMTESDTAMNESALLENVEKEVRSQLGLVKPGTEQQVDQTQEKGRTVVRTPSGPKTTGTRRSTPKLTGLEQEFEDLLPEGFDPFTPKK